MDGSPHGAALLLVAKQSHTDRSASAARSRHPFATAYHCWGESCSAIMNPSVGQVVRTHIAVMFTDWRTCTNKLAAGIATITDTDLRCVA